ncbi:hypothetical protein [Iodidimonas sp. SYSU 1G8]|uniref:hypothetical protein n=1 Tax=Iodidimonas sp. SYSU 1G8 TaxID=3133967 RepID=UPI0031FEBC4C
MRMLSCLLLATLSASPALAEGPPPAAGAASSQTIVAQGQAAPAANAQPVRKRALACPACRTDEMPSFAIVPDAGPAAGAAGAPPVAAGTEVPGAAAAPPPVNFSFSGSSNGSGSNKYRGGVRVGTQF